MKQLFVALTRNPISLFGVAITTASGLLSVTLFALEIFGLRGSPYIGILAYLVLPMFFVLGLVLMPIGIARDRKRTLRAKERGEPEPSFPVFDLNTASTRHRFLAFLVFSAANVVILATATYKGVEVMETKEFCGTACHSVMEPEYTTYQRSPHARVPCVECHIGSGADWFVKSKLSGAWQVVSVALDLYPRPIPTPVENLRPARDTCEHCHWPTKFVGNRLKVNTHYASNESNTELTTVLLLKVGGLQGRKSHGIHWHVDPAIRIRYRADASRETIYDVELTDEDGSTHVYSAGNEPDANGAPAEEAWRVMDCVDCHNRPSHIYRMPEEEIDHALKEGTISTTLPFIRRQGLSALRESYTSHEEARRGIAEAIETFYASEYPDLSTSDGETIRAAARTVGDIYSYNVFPGMNVTWGSYPNHIGHVEFDGCFRCHNDEHSTADGRTISQDCDSCHTLLAMEEEDPEILKELRP